MTTVFKKNSNNVGFTLVELLIVIAILGVIIIIVVAALNPIEQLNRSRDTSYKKSAGDLVTATERYFAGRSEYPWVTVLGAGTTNNSSIGFANANLAQFGVCAADAACPDAGGPLIKTNELKTEFMNRDFLKSAAAVDDVILIGKAAGANSSVYACYVPKSKSAQDKACTDGKVYTLSSTDGTRTKVASTTCSAAQTWNTTWNVCVPE